MAASSGGWRLAQRAVWAACVALLTAACAGGGEEATGDPVSGEAVVALDEIPPRLAPALVALDDGTVFVAGGSTPPSLDGGFRSDAWLVDVEAEVAEPLPSLPSTEPLRTASAVAVGSVVVVVGVRCAEGRSAADSPEPSCVPGTPFAAAFDRTSGQWTTLVLPDELSSLGRDGGPVSVSALGHVAPALAVFEIGTAPGDVWAVDMATATWSRIGRPPVAATPNAPPDAGYAGSLIGSCLAGGEVVAIESARPLSGLSGGSGAVDVVSHRVAVANVSPQWVPGPTLVEHEFAGIPRIGCLGEQVLLTDGDGVERGAWLATPADPVWVPVATPAISHPAFARVWTGEELVLVNPTPGADSHAFDPATSTFRRVPGGPGAITGPAVAAGGAIVGVAESAAVGVAAGEVVVWR